MFCVMRGDICDKISMARAILSFSQEGMSLPAQARCISPVPLPTHRSQKFQKAAVCGQKMQQGFAAFQKALGLGDFVPQRRTA